MQKTICFCVKYKHTHVYVHEEENIKTKTQERYVTIYMEIILKKIQHKRDDDDDDQSEKEAPGWRSRMCCKPTQWVLGVQQSGNKTAFCINIGCVW